LITRRLWSVGLSRLARYPGVTPLPFTIVLAPRFLSEQPAPTNLIFVDIAVCDTFAADLPLIAGYFSHTDGALSCGITKS
jgi:hypothetical protein